MSELSELVNRSELVKSSPGSLMGSVIETLQVMKICEEKLENGEEIPKELMQLDHSLSNFKQNVDKRIALLERIDEEIGSIEREISFYESKKKLLAEMKNKVKEHTKAIVEQFPDVEFKGTNKRFAIQKNGGKQGIEWKIEMEELPYVLRKQDVQYCPEAYVIEKTVKVLNIPMLEEDIRNGKLQTDIAKLKERGTHLRIK